MATQDCSTSNAVQALSQQHPSWAVESKTHNGRDVVDITADGSPAFDFAFLQPDQRLELAVSIAWHGTDISIVNVPAAATVDLTITAIPANENTAALKLRACHGSVRLRSCPHPLTIEAGDSACTVIIDSDASATPLGGMSDCVVQLDGGTLVLSESVSMVRINSSGIIRHINESTGGLAQAFVSAPSIDILTVTSGCELELRSAGLHIGEVLGPTDGSRPALTITAHTEGLMGGTTNARSFMPLGPAAEVKIDSASNVELRLGQRASKIEGLGLISSTTIVGPMILGLAESSIGDTIEFDSSRGPVKLRTGKGSVLTDLTGTMTVVSVAHSTLSAGDDTLTIAGLNTSAQGEDGPCHGAVLTGIDIPRGLEGRRMLAQLADVYHLSPDPRTVPGRDQTVLTSAHDRDVDYSLPANRATLVQDAEFVRELARLSRDKGAPGSVVTKIAWCSYRLRALKARGKVERVALAGYRLIGYGERPMPALISWFLLSVLLAGPVLFARGYEVDFSGNGFANFITEAARLALGPAAVVTRSGSLTTADLAELAARVLTSIPLITGVLAVRNYLKSDAS